MSKQENPGMLTKINNEIDNLQFPDSEFHYHEFGIGFHLRLATLLHWRKAQKGLVTGRFTSHVHQVPSPERQEPGCTEIWRQQAASAATSHQATSSRYTLFKDQFNSEGK